MSDTDYRPFLDCFFCGAELPVLDPDRLPHRERLSFDPELGRLWRVCGSCQRWNPVPLEYRWEVLERCERLCHDEGHPLLHGDRLSLYAVGDGQLVRVGEPPRVEMADWRYSERLDDYPVRRRSGWITRLLRLPEPPVMGYSVSTYTQAPRGVPPQWVGRPFIEHGALLGALFAEVPLADACPACGLPLLQLPYLFGDARLLLERDAPVLSTICALCGAETAVSLSLARPALRAALGILERTERGTDLVRAATHPIERVGGPQRFISGLARRKLDLGSMAARDRLALWICLDEQAEAEALEAEWRRAEDLTSIFDHDLTSIPGFDEFRARVLAEMEARP